MKSSLAIDEKRTIAENTKVCSIYETVADLDRVRAFTQVVQAGSFTEAAVRLDMPKGKVSRWVSELETHLGVRLLNRTTRQVSLTDAGRSYFERTEQAILQLEAANRAIHQLQDEPQGVLRISVPVDLADASLMPIFAEYCRQCPQVRLSVLATNRRVDLVAEGIDLAMRAGPLLDSTMVARRLQLAPMGLFASPRYLDECGAIQSMDQLREHRCLVFGRVERPQQWTLRHGARTATATVMGVFAASDYGTLAGACIAGIGVARLPSPYAGPGLGSGSLVRVLPQWRGEEALFHAVYPSASYLSPAVRKFVDLAVVHFEQLEENAL